MGKINKIIVEPLKNGDKGRDCEAEKWCGEPAYQLSSSDRKIGNTLTPIQPYKRTIRYKCSNGHRFEKEFYMEKNLLDNEITKLKQIKAQSVPKE